MSKSIEGELVLNMNALNSKIQKHISGALSVHGISFTEYTVLRQLVKANGNKMRRIDLAEQVGLSASGVTRLLNPMEKIGLVRKENNSRDARVSLVVLSSAGNRIFNESEVSFNFEVKTFFKDFEPANFKILANIVDSLI